MVKKYTFDDVKQVVAINHARNVSFLEYYKNDAQYVMDRQLLLDSDDDTKWQANIKSPTTFYLSRSLYGMYQTAQTTFDITSKETVSEVGKKMLTINEHYFDINDTREWLDRIALDGILLGTWFGQIVSRKISDEIRYTWSKGKIKKNKEYTIPSIEYINPMNIFIDPAAKSIYNSRFVIIRKIINKGNIDSYYSHVLWGKTTKKEIFEWGEIVEPKDWDMVVRYMMFNNMPWVEWAGYRKLTNWLSQNQHYDILTDNSFTFWERKDNKYVWDLLEVYELHTDDTIQVFVNGIDIGTKEKDTIRRKKPFFSIKLKSWLDFIHWVGVGHLAYHLQKMADMFENLKLDSARLEATAPIAVDSGEAFFDGQNTFKPMPWKIVRVTDTAKSYKKIEYGYNPNIAWDQVEPLTKQIQDSLWLSWYSMGVQQKVERVARWVQELVESVDRGFADFVNSYGRAMSFIQKYRAIMTVSSVDKEYLDRVVDDATDVKNIQIEDIVYEYKFGFNLSPMQKAKDSADVAALISFLQTGGNMMRPDGTPLVDNEFVIDQLIQKMNLPEWTKLTQEEALDYMKKQIANNAELKKMEQWQLPEPMPWQDPQWVVPDFNTKKDLGNLWAAGGTPWVQQGSIAGEAKATNVEWVNQFSS